MRTVKCISVLITICMLLAGCTTTGIIYSRTTKPLTLDMHRTPATQTTGQGEIKHIQIMYLGVAWDSNAIGDIAKKHGLKEICFADLETLSVLGIWNRYTVHVYGR